MKSCLRNVSLLLIILVGLGQSIMAAPLAEDKPAKEESPKSAASADKPAKSESATETTSTDKSTKAEAAKPAASAEKPVKESKEEPAAATKTKPAKEEPAAAATPAAPPTHTVKREPIKVQFELEGTFESRNMTEIILHPEEWITFTVKEAVEHGARVKKGDVLVEFDSEKIDKAIADLRTDLHIAEITLKLTEDQLANLEKSTPIDLEASERAQRIAEEDQKRYFDIGRPMMLKTVDYIIKMYQQEFENAREELDQLEKMYKADDLTEETEKIVLKRARYAVERAKFMLEREEYDREQTLKYLIPRNDVQIKESTQRRNLAWAKDRVELPLALEKQRLDVARQKVQIDRAKERLKNIVADQELMKIKSPTDGYVYYGRCQRGRFNEIATMNETLRHGGSAMPHRAIMTIVEPRPVFVHSTISEDRMQYARNGMEGKATPTGYPDIKLDVTVDELGKVPISMGSFDLQLSLDLEEQLSKVIVPGMSCKIKFVPYSKSDALIIPPKCLMTDPLDDEKHFVYLQLKDGKTEKHDVTVGKQNDKQVEILKGLSEGDKILLEAPKDAK